MPYLELAVFGFLVSDISIEERAYTAAVVADSLRLHHLSAPSLQLAWPVKRSNRKT